MFLKLLFNVSPSCNPFSARGERVPTQSLGWRGAEVGRMKGQVAQRSKRYFSEITETGMGAAEVEIIGF